ncbi:trypsin-like serine protease [Ruania alkalisoli]|uniref:Trypsin-like serine protease n=1 Tax=Ruania alkalisoli TaxID=2779775 RepID=A0A7M1SSZ9_9MICO|nr:trypsin-like serine protease [Ruania alkalisoli]QOR70094.1 trypsin-like serine protease [Ruania alkalisoli]
MTRIRTLAAGAIGLAVIAATAAPASAIRYGEDDAGEHPNVGLMIAYVEDESGVLQPSWRCSGTMMDPDTYLTAGHCTFGADAVAIWFADDLQGDERPDIFDLDAADATGTPYSHPEYDDAAFYLHDVGVVELDEPVAFDSYGQLPEQGYWDDQLATKKKDRDSFDVVGYGLQRSLPDNGTAQLTEAEWIKLQATVDLIRDDRMFGEQGAGNSVTLTNNANTGGTCSGDSGGPTFIEDSNVVAGVTSYGVNSTCTGIGGSYRIDQPDDLAWLSQFIG